jgi:geranyl-CoA carboxylase alpha subunit
MIAKVIAHGATRDQARERLAQSLDNTVALGLPTNKRFLTRVLRDKEFAAHGATTDLISRRFPRIEATEPDNATLAVAAVLLASNAGYGEWNSWSNNPARVVPVRFGEHEVSLNCERGAYRARVRDENIEPDPDDRSIYAIENDAIHIAHDGESFRLDITTHTPAARRASAASDGRLIAPMNGRVVAVNAKAGETMEAGTALIVLEAMKMEHALSVPQPARVTAVHVAPSDQVAPGQLLVELEPMS